MSVALKPTTIRFATRAYDLIQGEAGAQGVSVAQYVREAALIRVTIDWVDHHSDRGAVTLAELVRQVRELSSDSEPMDRRADDPD